MDSRHYSRLKCLDNVGRLGEQTESGRRESLKRSWNTVLPVRPYIGEVEIHWTSRLADYARDG